MELYTPVLVLAAHRRGLRGLLGDHERAGRAQALQPGQARLLRVRHRADAAAGRRRPLPGEVLHHRDAVHRLRHRDHLPLPVGRALRRAARASGWSRWSCSSPPCSSPTPTSGAAADSTGTERHYMGIEEKLPSGVLLTTVEGVAGYMRKASFWPATFGLACCAIEMMTTGGPKYDLARFGMEVFRASPRQADLMIVAGRVSQKMAPVLRQIYDQMPEPKWVLAMGVCASSGGMFNNYAIVQGVDHVVPVDMYLPGCPPRPEMLIDAILKLHDQVQHKQARRQPRRRDRGARDRRPRARCPTSRDEGPAAVTERARPDHDRRHRARREVPAEVARPASACAQGMFGVSRHRRHQRVRRPGRSRSSSPAPASARTAAGSTRSPTPSRRGCGRPTSTPPSSRSSSHRGEITFHVRREDLPFVAQMLRDDERAALRALLRASAASTTPTTPAASCTRSTTCSR